MVGEIFTKRNIIQWYIIELASFYLRDLNIHCASHIALNLLQRNKDLGCRQKKTNRCSVYYIDFIMHGHLPSDNKLKIATCPT